MKQYLRLGTTYEELKHELFGLSKEQPKARLGTTYEELKQGYLGRNEDRPQGLGTTYEELKQVGQKVTRGQKIAV